MPLFQVPGWKTPDAGPTASPASRKRKRRSSDESLHTKLNTASINFDTLVRKISGSTLKGQGSTENVDTPKKKKEKDGAEKNMSKSEKKKAAISGPMKLGHGTKKDSSPSPLEEGGKKKAKERAQTGEDLESVKSRASTVSQPPAKRVKKEGSMRSSAAEPEVVKTIEIEGDLSGAGLTKLQREMKEKLDGARFRQINEQLYKSESQASHELLRADPKVFEDYHTGFRHQVHSWPTNPVDTYATLLSSYPPKTIIADIGCGDAQLAKSLVKEGLNVLSFDLVASDYVVEADICRYIPLPGSAPEGVQTGAAIVDVVVCSLALMGTNWPGCVREAWRILKDEGELKIAEVSSRFTDMKKFIEVIKNVGFKLVSKDDSNTHFLMLEFVKDAKKTKLKSEADVVALMNRGSLLKACEYKKR